MPDMQHLTRETDENIVQLLAGVAFPEGKFSPAAVITNDSRLWMSQFPREHMTLLDISLLAAPEPGRGRLIESEMEAEVMRKLLSVGWPRERIIEQYSPRAGVHTDLGLIGGDGKAVAIVEVKVGPDLLGKSLEQLQAEAKLAGVRYATVGK
jgi:hypothetical protein